MDDMSSVRERTTTQTHKALIDAVNVLGRFADKNLPSGWRIDLELGVDEGCLILIDPSGNEIHRDSPDYGISSFADACDTAWDIENERPTP